MEPFGQDRPLWQLTFVTGLSRRRVALLERVITRWPTGLPASTWRLCCSMSLVTLGPRTDPNGFASRNRGEPLAPRHDHGTGRVRLQMAAAAATALLPPAELRRRAGDLGQALRGVTSHGLLAPRSTLNRPTGRDRTLTFVRQRLDAVKAAGAVVGAIGQ